MNKPFINETKLPKVMDIIDEAASLMEEKDCDNDEKAIQILSGLQKELADITGNPSIKITDFKRYWSYISLEEIAKKALMLPPVKEKLTDTQVREIVLNILSHNSEAEMDYWIEYLTINTGLPDLTDYIFYPDIKGLDGNASLEEIADKIISDMYSSNCLD